MADFRITLNTKAQIIDQPWDSGAAEKRLFAWASNAAGELDFDKVSAAYLIADPSTKLKGDLHMPVGDIVDGEMVINAAALRAALSRLGQGTPLDVPADVRERATKAAKGLLDDFNARQDGEPDEATIHGWLVEHYSHGQKLSQPRIQVLLGLRDKYPYLRAPETDRIYRGLSNISPSIAGKLVGESDATRDKSWTTSLEQATKFSSGDYIPTGDINNAKVGAIMHGSVSPDALLLDADAIAKISAIADQVHPIWNEPLRNAIATEREVVVFGPVDVMRVEVLPMARQDFAADSLCVVLPIPAAIAAQFPEDAEVGAPHVTCVYVKHTSEEQLAAAMEAVRAVAPTMLGSQVNLGPLSYFDNDMRVAHCAVDVAPVCVAAQGALAQALASAGLDVSRLGESWKPHATLGYIEPGTDWTGTVPTGSWPVDSIEIWRAGERYVFDGAEHYDRIEERNGKWVVLSADGYKELGPYDTEAEARERLRQIEAAKAAKDAAPGQQALFGVGADGSVLIGKPGAETRISMDAAGAITIDVRPGAAIKFGGTAAGASALGMAGALAGILATGNAPAIHVESRTNSFDIVRADRVEMAADCTPIIHPYGWVTYPVLYSRADNIQVYNGIREFRPRKSVFDRASMDSGIGSPWELRHSSDLLTPSTVLGAARGVVLTVDEYHDGLHTFGWAKAWDAALRYAIEGVNGQKPMAPEVSVAYGCRVHRGPGTDDYGRPFDQWIDNITWNSLASEPHGAAITAKVLTGRADAAGIRVHSADELIALALSARPPVQPVFFDPPSWTRFDSASAKRPAPPTQQQDSVVMLKKKLIPAAMALGLTEDVIATAIGIKPEDMAKFMESEEDLTPDQINALGMAFPDAPKAPAAAAPPVPPAMPTTDAGAPAVVAANEEVQVPVVAGDLATLVVGEAEYQVPLAVAEYVAMLEGRTDRAGKRADKAEHDLAKTEQALAAAKTTLTERSDAMSKMVSHADALGMVNAQALHIAESMALVARCRGNEYTPEPRKDAASGEPLPLSIVDWEMAAIREAYGDKAEAIIKRIDAAPTPEARSYAVRERLADAREMLDRRDHKGTEALASVERLRAANAVTDATRQDDDPLAKAQQVRNQYTALPVGAPPTQPHGAA